MSKCLAVCFIVGARATRARPNTAAVSPSLDATVTAGKRDHHGGTWQALDPLRD